MNISPVLFHVYGPIAVHWYGLCIALGVFIALNFLIRDYKLAQLITMSELFRLFERLIFVGYFSARIFSFLFDQRPLSDLLDIIKFWEPGFSILGCIIGIVLVLFLHVYKYRVQGLKLLDRLAIYAPLIQAFGRIGCFFAGCCHGKIVQSTWAIVYTHPESAALLYVPLYPAQLCSSFILFGIFALFYFVLQYRFKTPGILACFYLCIASLERFLLDFVRYDYVGSSVGLVMLSQQQILALIMMCLGVCGVLILLYKRKR